MYFTIDNLSSKFNRLPILLIAISKIKDYRCIVKIESWGALGRGIFKSKAVDVHDYVHVNGVYPKLTLGLLLPDHFVQSL
jgi:hypothetical protein